MKIYLTEPVSDILINYINKNHTLTTDLYDSDIAIVRNKSITEDDLNKTNKLKLVAVHGTGYNMVDIKACTKRGIKVFNTPNLNTNAVAELNVMLMLMLSRRYEEVKSSRILGDMAYLGQEIKNKTVGFIGVGNIAKRTAEILKGFNCNMIGYNRTKKESPIPLHPFDYVLENSDYILISLALNNDTERMINKTVFNKLKRKPYLINSARGAIINNDDLYEALVTNKIKGFGADVYYPEPIDINSPLLKENVIILPHIGANTKEALDVMAENIIKGIDSYINNEEIDNLLEF